MEGFHAELWQFDKCNHAWQILADENKNKELISILNVISFFSQCWILVLKVCNFKILSFWNWLAYVLAYIN